MSQIYFELASILKNRSFNFRGFTHLLIPDFLFSDIVLALVLFGLMIIVFIGYEIYARKKKLDKRYLFLST